MLIDRLVFSVFANDNQCQHPRPSMNLWHYASSTYPVQIVKSFQHLLL